MDKARESALRVLNAVYGEGAYANVALAGEIRRRELGELDRRLATEISYGVVKKGESLDWQLSRYINRPLKKIDPPLLNILRLGLYQLLYLSKIPPSAACNEAVELAKKYSHSGGAKFVNGVLRAAVRQPEKASFPAEKDAAALALRENHPRWLTQRLIKLWGYEKTAAYCRCNNENPPLSLRVNTLKTDRQTLLAAMSAENITASPSAWAPEGIVVSSHGALDKWEPLKAGLAQVQDESSMLVAHILSPRPGEIIIDACSAPGGKTTHIAALMENKGRILAGDIYEHKLKRLTENARRLGISIIEPLVLEAEKLGKKYPALADRVLVDAPCSGLGVLRRKVDSRWRKNESQLQELPRLQTAILAGAGGAVKPGGVLVYSTCTVLPEENERVVEAFLQANSDFYAETAGEFLPVTKRRDEMLTLYPERDGTDGFFIARLRRKAN